MKITKDSKGITLIALVITIIVLLILAGVALATLTGNTSIIDNANYAVTEYNKSAGNDQNVLNQVENLFAKYMGNSNDPERIAMIQEQYGDLVNPSKDTVTHELFTYETYEPGESMGQVRHVSGNRGLEGVISRGDTPSAEPQKGTAKITGINWGYFVDGDLPEKVYDEETESWVNSIPENPSNIMYRDDSGNVELQISTLEMKERIENTLRKLIIPYEVVKDGKVYEVTAVDIPFGEFQLGHFSEDYFEITGENVPALAITGSWEDYNTIYQTGATDEDETFLIVPACVQSFKCYFPRDNIIFADNSQITSIPDYAFAFGEYASSTAINYINIPQGVRTIGEGAFARTNITEIALPESVEIIKGGCFEGCEKLTKIYIPAGVTEIEYSAFDVAPLDYKIVETTIYYGGSLDDWEKIEKGEDAFAYRNITIVPGSSGIPKN